jgi:penicillin-binding protein-related factor A (putative recombinase)
MNWKNEKEFQGAFTKFVKSEIGGRWIREASNNYGVVKDNHTTAIAFELKVVREKAKGRFRLSQVEGHQWDALQRVSCEEGLMYKISDSGIGYKPFDCFYIALGSSKIVIGYVDTQEAFFVDPGALYEVKEKGERSVEKEWVEKWGKKIPL